MLISKMEESVLVGSLRSNSAIKIWSISVLGLEGKGLGGFLGCFSFSGCTFA